MRAEGMDPDPEDVIVTTGGQQAIDLVTQDAGRSRRRRHRRGPTYPGAVPVFCSYEAETIQVGVDDDGMRIDELEELLDRLEAEGRRPKFIYTVPSFQNPAGVTMSAGAAAAAGRDRARARAARRRGQPLRAAPLRGRGAADRCYTLEGGDYVHLPRDALEDPLPRDPARLALRAAAGDGEGRARQAGRRPLHLDADPVLRPRVLRRGPLARVRRDAARASTASGATRCSRRSSASSPPRPTWSRPGRRAVLLGDAARLHRHHRPAGEGAARERRLRPRRRRLRRRPRRRARCGSTSPPQTEDEIAEGVRRIGA